MYSPATKFKLSSLYKMCYNNQEEGGPDSGKPFFYLLFYQERIAAMKNKRGLFRLYLKSEPSTRADRILYVVTVIVSVILLIGGYWFAVRNGTVLGQNLGGIQSEEYRARITEVVSSNDIYSQYSDSIAERRTVC